MLYQFFSLLNVKVTFHKKKTITYVISDAFLLKNNKTIPSELSRLGITR